MSNWVVERLEGRDWRAIARYTFEDKEILTNVAKSQLNTYRILRDGEDVTALYGGKQLSSPVYNEPPKPKIAASDAMKPSAYKSSSDADKQHLWNRINDLRSKNTKRSDILIHLNITEATYDVIRADMNKHESKSDNSSAVTVSATQHNVTTQIRRQGLLGRR